MPLVADFFLCSFFVLEYSINSKEENNGKIYLEQMKRLVKWNNNYDLYFMQSVVILTCFAT